MAQHLLKAHKRVKVAPAERGFSIFALADPSGARRWVVYNTCHFGCSWAAYWWSRVAAGFVRLSHRLIYHTHFGSMFVDDKLSLFPAGEAAIMACLQVVLACALGIPLSWHKMLLGTFVKWIGWQLDLRGVPRAFLPEDKVTVICLALRRVCRGSPISRRELESLIGRLLWFTGGMRWLRPWMSTWFHMASKPTLRFLHLDWGQVDELLELLGEDLRVCRHARFSDARCGWRLLECGGRTVHRRDEIMSPSWKMGVRGSNWVSPMLRISSHLPRNSGLPVSSCASLSLLDPCIWLSCTGSRGWRQQMLLLQDMPQTSVVGGCPRIQLHAYRTFGGSPANSV